MTAAIRVTHCATSLQSLALVDPCSRLANGPTNRAAKQSDQRKFKAIALIRIANLHWAAPRYHLQTYPIWIFFLIDWSAK